MNIRFKYYTKQTENWHLFANIVRQTYDNSHYKWGTKRIFKAVSFKKSIECFFTVSLNVDQDVDRPVNHRCYGVCLEISAFFLLEILSNRIENLRFLYRPYVDCHSYKVARYFLTAVLCMLYVSISIYSVLFFQHINGDQCHTCRLSNISLSDCYVLFSIIGRPRL